MKAFDELTPKQQTLACEKALAKILEKVCDGTAKFPGNPAMQSKIEAASVDAERPRTPGYMLAFVMDSCRAELEAFAQTYARGAFYREPGDLVLSL